MNCNTTHYRANSSSVPGDPTELLLFAAASLKEPFTALAHQFEAAQSPAGSVTVTLNLAGSNQLRQQLAAGAPCDVFASADTKQMDGAVSDKSIESTSVRLLGQNALALIVPRSNPAKITSLADLARPAGQVRIVIADAAVPVGAYTGTLLERASQDAAFDKTFSRAFLANVVSREQSVAGVLSKVRLAEADAGIVYATDARSASADVTRIDFPAKLSPVAQYVIAPARGSKNPELAEKLVQFLTSREARASLTSQGFSFPASGDGPP